MKVLWLTNTPGLFYQNKESNGTYNGGGWEASLQLLFAGRTDVSLAVAFESEMEKEKKVEQDGFIYYPIYSKPKSAFNKLKLYYGGYKHVDSGLHIPRIKEIIEDFTPDIIHIHGLENTLANILLHDIANVPIVVSLQGLLLPYSEAFFPEGVDEHSFRFPLSLSEHIFRNGYRYAYKSIRVRAEHEMLLWAKVKNVFGRTCWDKSMCERYSSGVSYHYGGEVLRDAFYANAGSHEAKEDIRQIRICSTISNTVYKGLDVILKTAKTLQEKGVDYEWNVIGIDASCRLIKHFSRQFHIDVKSLNIKFCGVKNAREIVDMVRLSDVFIHPSHIDNSPNSVCEAQMIGCPVIANNVGGLPSLIDDGKTGLLVPTNTIEELVSCICELKQNAALRRAISANSVAVALKRHDRNTIIEHLIRSYNKIQLSK